MRYSRQVTPNHTNTLWVRIKYRHSGSDQINASIISLGSVRKEEIIAAAAGRSTIIKVGVMPCAWLCPVCEL
ncbi:hypothetical protein Back11_13200 [Paenibacillus baekrokdamisoli]|uniref:Uncharacterized protein n=1 Tax=Paenibacillus baekrokdamisoli TaxID=1712516 RepID=A0A3G9IV62_9BACL|nr:hypothetical protein Back11_13200 [Paenibacillus baekrokdamisoli]